jgi:hypothetical protein
LSPTLRVAPVGLAYPPGFAALPAAISASITHLHPTASATALVMAELVSRLVRGVPLTPAVAQTVLTIPGELDGSGSLRTSVEVALRGVEAGDPPDSAVVPPGDGGLRSASGLALALWVALRHGPLPSQQRFAAAIAEVSALAGNRRGVGGLVGALLGGSWGYDALPAGLVGRLERHREIVDIGRALHLRASGIATALRRPEIGPRAGGWSDGAAPERVVSFRRDAGLVDDVITTPTEVAAQSSAADEEPEEEVLAWVSEGAVDREAQLEAWRRGR